MASSDFILISYILKHKRQNNEHTRMGEVALWPTSSNTSPSQTSGTSLPPHFYLTLHPPSQPARPALLSTLQTSCFSEWPWAVCVHTVGMNGSVFFLETWMQCVAPDRQAYSFTLLFHFSNSLLFHPPMNAGLCWETYTQIHTNSHTDTGTISFKKVYSPHIFLFIIHQHVIAAGGQSSCPEAYLSA